MKGREADSSACGPSYPRPTGPLQIVLTGCCEFTEVYFFAGKERRGEKFGCFVDIV